MQGRTGARRNFDVYISDRAAYAEVELIVPNSIESSEYAQQTARIIEALATLERREESLVARSIREVAYDVLRSRIPDTQVFSDAIRLEVARSFIGGIRSVLAAAATTELRPLPYFLRLRKEAAEYADRCRFGHTFRGSFGFTVESPLHGHDQIALPGMVPPPPFERRVIQRLTRGLATVSQAVKTDSIDPITNAVNTGFSANVCEQLATLVQQTSPAGLDFDFSFSPEWQSDNETLQPSQTYHLAAHHVEVIRAAAKELRTQVQSWPETVYGRVIRLASEADPSDLTDLMGEREIAILWSSDALGDITVRTALNPTDYLKALEAHAAGRPVEVSGTLERRARGWVLLDPSGFTFHG